MIEYRQGALAAYKYPRSVEFRDRPAEGGDGQDPQAGPEGATGWGFSST